MLTGEKRENIKVRSSFTMATESINAVKSRVKSIREWVTPARTTSAFLSKGVLTPEEFVRAGDELVFKCPTWSWEGGGEASRRKFQI